jgi:hypothetical protein
MLISEQYRSEQAALHAKGNYGRASLQYGDTVAALLSSTKAKSILDYGCGSMRNLRKVLALPGDVVYEGYDPAIPEYAAAPLPAELVCCIDVLEHIEPELLDNVLDHLAELCDPYGFFTIHTGPALKVLSDGRNAHLTQQGPDWWLPRLRARFDVLAMNPILSGFAVVVRSQQSGTRLALPSPLVLPTAAPPATDSAAPTETSAVRQVVLKHKGVRLVFIAPDDAQFAHVRTALQSQPETIDWLERLPQEATLLDIGAGSGVQALFAAAMRKANVLAFEGDPANVALLGANVALNDMASRVSTVLQAPDGASAPAVPGPSIDQLVDAKAIPVPDAVRVAGGAWGLEQLRGAAGLLQNPKVTRVLVSVDPAPAELRATTEWLGTLGFTPEQHSTASNGSAASAPGATTQLSLVRGTGDHEGVLPWSRKFAMTMGSTSRGRSVLRHVLARVAAADVIEDPFPYAVIDGILPDDYYAEALEQFPTPESLRPIGESGRVPSTLYRERHVVLFTDEDFRRMSASQQAFWREFADWMYSDLFLNAFVTKFQAALEPRLERILDADAVLRARGDALLVNDMTNYAIGPHTDAPHRLVTFLFYLPRDDSMRELGTSVYRPKDPNFVCWGGPHHPFEKFEHVNTVEYLPNRLLTFPKTERSFHGVGQITRQDVNRPLLINNIRLLNPTKY